MAEGDDAGAFGEEALAFGHHATAVESGTAVGSSSLANGPSGTALGSNAHALNAGDVALGSGSTTQPVVATPSARIGGTLHDFAGGKPSSVASIGAPLAERTLVNVAAGRISPTSTDAVNGSQLHAVSTVLDNMAEATVNSMSAFESSLTTNIGKLATGLKALDGRIAARSAGVDTTLGKLTTDIGTTHSEVGTLATSTTAGLQALDSRIATRSATVDTTLGKLATDIGTTRSDVNTLSTSTTAGLRTLQTDLGKLGTRTTSLASHLDQADHDIDTLAKEAHQNAAALATGMADITGHLNRLQTTLGEQAAQATRMSGIATDLNGTGADRPAVTPGSNSAAIGAQSRDEGRADVVSIGSASRQRQLVNVAPGTQATDAVNLGQLGEVRSTLSAALAQQQQQIGSLGTQLQQTDRMARQGIAAVGAMASIPELDRDANFGVGLGTSTFLGQKAMALAVRARVSDNLKLSINGGVAGAQRVLGTGVLYQWK